MKLGYQEEEKKERWSRIFEVMMAENFQKLVRGSLFIPPNLGVWDKQLHTTVYKIDK